MSTHAICVRDFRFRHEDGTELHFHGGEMRVQHGERAVLLGCNGSGKTTLLSHMIGLKGTRKEWPVEVLGLHPRRDFKELRRRIGFVLQEAEHQVLGPTVYDDIAFSLRCYERDEGEVRQRVETIMERFGIDSLRDRAPHCLSGGSLAKVALASTLVTRPELLVLDEPFTNIDPVCTREIIDILNQVNREQGVTIVMTNQNIETVPPLADTVHLMAQGGRFEAHGSPEEVFSDVEAMLRCHIHPPVLNRLQSELQKRGIRLQSPVDLPHVVEQLAQRLGTQTPKILDPAAGADDPEAKAEAEAEQTPQRAAPAR